jgi:hypothetical protein
MIVAEKLGYTLSELLERMTPEELLLWAAFYELRNEAAEKAKQRR